MIVCYKGVAPLVLRKSNKYNIISKQNPIVRQKNCTSLSTKDVHYLINSAKDFINLNKDTTLKSKSQVK